MTWHWSACLVVDWFSVLVPYHHDYVPQLTILRFSSNRLVVNRAIHEAKTQYYTKHFQNHKSDIRTTWGVISKILSKKQSRRNSLKSIVTDGHIISDSKIILQKFNDFFLNVGPTIAASLRTNVSRTHKSYLNENILTSFQFNLVDEDHIGKMKISEK